MYLLDVPAPYNMKPLADFLLVFVWVLMILTLSLKIVNTIIPIRILRKSSFFNPFKNSAFENAGLYVFVITLFGFKLIQHSAYMWNHYAELKNMDRFSGWVMIAVSTVFSFKYLLRLFDRLFAKSVERKFFLIHTATRLEIAFIYLMMLGFPVYWLASYFSL